MDSRSAADGGRAAATDERASSGSAAIVVDRAPATCARSGPDTADPAHRCLVRFEAMAEAHPAPPGGASAIYRLFSVSALPPYAVGAAISVALLVLFFGVEWATGQIDRVLAGTAEEHIPLHFRISAVNAAVLGFLLTALHYLERWRTSTAAALQPLLESSAPVPVPDRRASAVVGLAAAAGGAYVFLVRPYGLALLLGSGYWVFEHVWDWLMVPTLFFLSGRLAYELVFDALSLSRRAADLAPIELLDLRPLFPFVRHGLRAALIVILYVVLGALHVGNPIVDAQSLRAVPILFLVLSTGALVMPVWGVHGRIADEKRAELGRLRARIARARDDLEGAGEGAQEAALRLPALLALEARIAAVREWPFDAPSLIRFGFYVLLGLGSWLGAAAVERILDLALG